MTTRANHGWIEELAVEETSFPHFLRSKDDIGSSTPQGHTVRQAFALLSLDGVLCSENAPLVYFKEVDAFAIDEIWELHRKFWNHGGAPILALVSPSAVQIFSGMSRPTAREPGGGSLPSFVTQIDRAVTALRAFLVSVETGAFFRRHSRSFDPAQRVDRDLLNNLRDARDVLGEVSSANVTPAVLDGLLCRLVFACYLFDRKVVGISYLSDLGLENVRHLRDVLAMRPPRKARSSLYALFAQLGADFNGDLFSDNLEREAELVTDDHLRVLNDFFHGTNVRTRQLAFWPYDFGSIPIETISAIYEHFLKTKDHDNGAFYTPRFLAEIVLDAAIEKFDTLLGKTFLDPACGSGIFLVGLFNRIAEEWKKANPNARNDTRARELMRILRESLFGIDINPTACRITAFSLYLAYLDQLTPRDIQELQRKGRALPRLVACAAADSEKIEGNITCTDFFEEAGAEARTVDLVIGNPPWGSIAGDQTPAGTWCRKSGKPIPDNQIATAFIWKALDHVRPGGPVCLILPHGVLFNHGPRAIEFQRAWVTQASIQRVLNLADFRWFLFGTAVHPALVVNFARGAPDVSTHVVDYWVPKTDWAITQAEVIPLLPFDRKRVTLSDLVHDLNGSDAPQVWTRGFWGTPRDIRLIDRLSDYPRLRDRVRQSREVESLKPWIMAEGFQPLGVRDDPAKAKNLRLPSRSFIPATSKEIDLFLLKSSCKQLEKPEVLVRSRSNTNTAIYSGPHVLVSEGFTNVAFADFDVAFQEALRGIHGPKEDADLLAFLAAYIRSSLAKYYIFHTTSSWGVARPVVRVQELRRLPFPAPENMPDPDAAWRIVRRVAAVIKDAAEKSDENLLRRSYLVDEATEVIEACIDEYFGIHPSERLLINDTVAVIIPSIQPNAKRMPVPTVKTATADQQKAYVKRICDTLSDWSRPGTCIAGSAALSESLGIGVTVLEKVPSPGSSQPLSVEDDVLAALSRLKAAIGPGQSSIAPLRGLIVFQGTQLYLVKPSGQRFWTQTAALNDADDIANTILIQPPSGAS